MRCLESGAKKSSNSSRYHFDMKVGLPCRRLFNRDVMAPAVACNGSSRQRHLIWLGTADYLAVAAPRPLLRPASSSEYAFNCHGNAASKLNEEGNPEANLKMGESRTSSSFPVGAFSALPRTRRIPRSLQARPYGQTMPAQVHMLQLDLVVRRQQTLPFGMSYSTSLDKLKVKSCEVTASSRDGITHATMRPAAACDGDLRQCRLIWVGAACRLAVAALLPPLTYATSSLGCETNCPIQKLDDQSRQAQALQAMPAQLLQEGLLEIAPRTEERQISLPLLMALVFEGSVFDAACKIGDLGKPIGGWTSLAIYQSLLPERVLECSMQGIRYQTLPVIVVNLYGIKLLEPFQTLEQEFDEVALHFPPKRDAIGEFALPIHKRLVAKGNAPNKRCEAEQITRSRFNVLIGKVLISMRQGHEVERLVLPTAFEKQPLIAGNFLRDIIRLVVKHKRQDVVLGIPAQIAGLIYEDGKLTHRESLQNKEAGGIPRPLTDLLAWKPIPVIPHANLVIQP